MIKKTRRILLGLLLLGSILLSSCAGGRAAQNGDTVTVNYTVKLEDGTIYGTSSGGEPLQVTLGESTLIPGFEEAIIGMRVGEKKTVTIPPEKAYGAYRPELAGEISKSKLPEGLEPVVGQELQTTGANGEPLTVLITGVTDTTVTLDANPHLAGKNLIVDVELVSIEGSAPASGIASQTSFHWMLLTLAILLALGFLLYRRRERGSRPERVGAAHRSDALLTELARLDDDFKAAEKAYAKERAKKKAELVKLMSREKKGSKS